MMNDGPIKPDSRDGKRLGFTSERFSEDSYLWKHGEYIIISFILSLDRGNFCELVKRIQGGGYGVKIPTPMGRMQTIVKRHYRHTIEDDPVMGPVEVWVLDPPDSEVQEDK